MTAGAERTLFYVADIHGSDLCFRKWLNAGRFYGADVLIIGGDLTGKILVPMYPASGNGAGGWTATWKQWTRVRATCSGSSKPDGALVRHP